MREAWMRTQCLELVGAALHQMHKKVDARRRKTECGWVGSSPDPVVVRLLHRINKYEVVQQCLLGEQPMTAIAYKLGWRPSVYYQFKISELEQQAALWIEDTYPIDSKEEDDR